MSKETGRIEGASRRMFLKASGLAAVGAVFNLEEAAGAKEVMSDQGGTPERKSGSSLAMVNLLQGTASTPEFSRGNTLPIAAMPFGMAHWTLQSKEGTPWMFHPADRRIQGLRSTHQLSPWLGDYGYATFLPVRGELNVGSSERASSYDLEKAVLAPNSLQLFLLRYRAHVELVPTERCCALTAAFEEDETKGTVGLLIDVPGKKNTFKTDKAKHTLRFSSSANRGGVPENFATYYVVLFPEAWESFEVKESGDSQTGIARFGAARSIEARIGSSFISFEQAERNLAKEIGNESVAEIRDRGAKQWEDNLGRIEIEGATLEQRRTFYSCLYRTLLFPRVWHEPDAKGEMHHFSAFNGKVMPGVMYADHGYWDVYRAWYPMMSLVFPERLGEILQAWVNAYQEGGWLPQFPCPGYKACMTGSLIDSIFGDAAVKKIAGFDLAKAYEGLKKHATTPGDPKNGYGRTGIELYLAHNYIPADRLEQSVAETVDAAYGDFCIAQVAKALGKQDDFDAFTKRSENWRNLFDSGTRFFRGKKEDGSWLEPFYPFTWGSPYVEGSAWQHRWDVPHNITDLVGAMGGASQSADELERMLTVEPIFHVGVYGEEIHEMSEMAAVRFGQYAHSNQPVHHLLYIFAHAGRPDRTQFWVRKVMRDLYGPDTFAGDEDTGAMAAWYVLSSLGFYSLCPGKPEYTLGSPLFSNATVHMENGKTLIIEAPGNSLDSVFVKSISHNGQPHKGVTVDHAALASGGTLHYNMAVTAK